MCVCVSCLWFQMHACAVCGLLSSLVCSAELVFQQGSKQRRISSVRDLILKSDAIIKINKHSVQA